MNAIDSFVNGVSLNAYVANETIMWQVSSDVASILILKKLKHFALIKNPITHQKITQEREECHCEWLWPDTNPYFWLGLTHANEWNQFPVHNRALYHNAFYEGMSGLFQWWK